MTVQPKGPPERVWLQWYCGEHDPSWGDPEPGDVTWCHESVFADDVEYIRADDYRQVEQWLLSFTRDFIEHPEGYGGPCECLECRGYEQTEGE